MVRETGKDFLLCVNAFDSPLYSYFQNHYGFRTLRELGKLPYEDMYKPNMGRIIEKKPYLTLDNLNHPFSLLQSGRATAIREMRRAFTWYWNRCTTITRP